jgi:hypothetical protein
MVSTESDHTAMKQNLKKNNNKQQKNTKNKKQKNKKNGETSTREYSPSTRGEVLHEKCNPLALYSVLEQKKGFTRTPRNSEYSRVLAAYSLGGL